MKRHLPLAALIVVLLGAGTAGSQATEGLDLPVADNTGPVESSQIRWLRQSDNAVVASAWAARSENSQVELIHLRASDLETGVWGAFQAEVMGNNVARVLGVAWNGTHSYSRSIIRSDGRSDFLQLDNTYRWKLEAYAISYDPPRLRRFSGTHVSLRAYRVRAGDLILFTGASGFQSAKLNIVAEGVATRGGRIKLAVFNMDNRAFDGPRKTYRFLVIHRDD